MFNIRNWLNSGSSSVSVETKNTAMPLIAFQSNTIAQWSQSNYASLSSDGFMRNPIVYRCIRLISESAASLPWLCYSGDDELHDHPVLKLLKRPNVQYGGQEFIEALYGHLLISGSAYLKQVSLNDEVRELHLLRPDKMKVITDQTGWPIAYEYTNGKHKQRFDFAPDNTCPVLHLRSFNPLDDMSGMPPMRAAHMALNLHNAASVWNKSLLDNSARPSGALVYTSTDHPNLNEEQFSRLKHELEEGYTGAARAGRPMLLEGGLDWKAMGYSPKDMDFIEAKNGASRDIALAFGVPPMLLGIPGDNTFANYKEANLSFWRQTIIPLVTRTCGILGNWLGPQFEPGLRLDVDRDKVEAIASDRSALWQKLESASFLTDDEKRVAAGYSPLELNNS